MVGEIKAFHRNQMPYICQADASIPVLAVHDPENKQGHGKISNQGTYCGPVAAAQALIGRCLADPSLQNLLPARDHGESENNYQSRIINKLAKDMGTSNDIDDPKVGTTPQQLMDGIEKFLVDRNFKLREQRWSGWGAGEVKNPSELLSLEEIQEAVANPNLDSIAHMGWYDESWRKDTFNRNGGHFAVFKGVNSDGTFTMHDPSPRAGGQASDVEISHLVNIGKLFNGKLEDGRDVFSASHNILTLKGIAPKPKENIEIFPILDGVFQFGIERKN
jgi:hypothetical protein